MKIGVISDTHGCFDDKLRKFLDGVDEIWHAGDTGSLTLIDEIAGFKPLKAVYGNIDGAEVRAVCPKFLEFKAADLKVGVTHITGYPGRYTADARALIQHKPDILVGGHSHILKIIWDRKNSFLFLNPGAAGSYGFHRVRTALRFTLDGKNIANMEIGEWDR
jgi:putative phosphoesterase